LRVRCKTGVQLGEVPQQHRRHGVALDPVDPRLGVDRGRIVAGEQPVALQAPRRHQNEHAERRVAEPEALRRLLGVHAHHQVDLVRVAVDLAQGAGELAVLRHLLEREHARLVKQLAKAVIARERK